MNTATDPISPPPPGGMFFTFCYKDDAGKSKVVPVLVMETDTTYRSIGDAIFLRYYKDYGYLYHPKRKLLFRSQVGIPSEESPYLTAPKDPEFTTIVDGTRRWTVRPTIPLDEIKRLMSVGMEELIQIFEEHPPESDTVNTLMEELQIHDMSTGS